MIEFLSRNGIEFETDKKREESGGEGGAWTEKKLDRDLWIFESPP
jgi:hypothetical protein